MTARKNRKTNAIVAAAAGTFAMTAVAELPAGIAGESSIVNSLLADLAEDGEVIEPIGAGAGDELTALEPAANEAGGDLITDDVLHAADMIAGKQAVYASQEPTDLAGDTSAPQTQPEALTGGKVKKSKGGKKAKKAAEAAGEPTAGEAAAAPEAPKAPKTPRATSVTHKPGALLKIKLGEKWRDSLAFNMADVLAGDDVLHAKQDEFIERMNDHKAIADKVKDKISMLLIWLQKGGELNEVLRRAFTVLHEKGELTSGDKGNLQQNLLSKPYSVGTARSQANQMFMALPEIGICVKEKGKMVANPDSVLWPMVKAQLGITS